MNPTPPEQLGPADSRTPNPAPLPAPFTLATIFLNRAGLRPIWSIALFLATWALLRLILFSIAQTLLPTTLHADSLIPVRIEYIFESATLLSVLTATWLMSRLESRPISTYGFAPHNRLRNFTSGIATGTALLSLLIFSLYKLHLLIFDDRLLFRIQILHYAILWAIGFLLVALAEETLLRAYLQFTVTRVLVPLFRRLTPLQAHSTAFWTAALILSTAFGAIHRKNPGESPIGLLAAALAGLVFCLSLWRTGSLWWAIGFHAAWDWAQSFLYGVPDSGLLVQGRLFATHPAGPNALSGGLTGPEGSALIFPILLAACATVFLTQPSQTLSS